MALDTKVALAKIMLAFAMVLFAYFAFVEWMKPKTDWPVVYKEISQDTQGKVSYLGSTTRHGVHVVLLKTPRGQEIAYLVHHRYLAIGPLIDLKTGKNITPVWTHDFLKGAQ